MNIYRRLSRKLNRLTKLTRAVVSRPDQPLYHIRCNFDNTGDIGVAQAINKIFQSFIIVDYSFNGKFKILENLIEKNLFKTACLGGGTLIFFPTNSVWFTALKYLIDQKANLLFTFGTGVRDPEFFKDISSLTITNWAECLKKLKLISVRGKLSYEILKNNGIDNVKITGDPALLYCKEDIALKRKNKTIGINISQHSSFYSDDKERPFAVLKNLTEILIKDKWNITLFPACEENLSLSYRLISELKCPDIKIHKKYWDVGSFLSSLEDQDIFIGVKLHPVIFAYCTYTPSLMIAYQPKCYDFMQTMEMEDFILRSDHLEVNLLRDKINNLYNNIEEIQRRQYKQCQKFKQRLLSFRDEVYKFTMLRKIAF
jgi:hypothetical protein